MQQVRVSNLPEGSAHRRNCCRAVCAYRNSPVRLMLSTPFESASLNLTCRGIFLQAGFDHNDIQLAKFVNGPGKIRSTSDSFDTSPLSLTAAPLPSPLRPALRRIAPGSDSHHHASYFSRQCLRAGIAKAGDVADKQSDLIPERYNHELITSYAR